MPLKREGGRGRGRGGDGGATPNVSGVEADHQRTRRSRRNRAAATVGCRTEFVSDVMPTEAAVVSAAGAIRNGPK